MPLLVSFLSLDLALTAIGSLAAAVAGLWYAAWRERQEHRRLELDLLRIYGELSEVLRNMPRHMDSQVESIISSLEILREHIEDLRRELGGIGKRDGRS